MTGRQFLAVLRRLPAEELDLDVSLLIDMHDRPICQDCGRHHATVWAAFACDDFTDARRRREARQRHRAIARQLEADAG